jgi:hypothetical protein
MEEIHTSRLQESPIHKAAAGSYTEKVRSIRLKNETEILSMVSGLSAVAGFEVRYPDKLPTYMSEGRT